MPTPLGTPAPDFVLRGWHGDAASDYRLSEQRGRRLVLVFYRGDEQRFCAKALRAYSEHLPEVRAHGADLWCIGAQDLHSHREFARRVGVHVPLLADTGGVVAGMYGVLGATHVRRAVFALDGAGLVRWRWVSRWNVGFPGVDRLVTELDRMGLPAG